MLVRLRLIPLTAVNMREVSVPPAGGRRPGNFQRYVESVHNHMGMKVIHCGFPGAAPIHSKRTLNSGVEDRQLRR